MMGAIGTESDGTTPSWSQDRAYCPPGFTGTCDPPVGEWKMDEYSGSTAYDTSSNSNDGSLQNDTTWESAAKCKYASCLSFDGDDDYVALGYDESFDFKGYDKSFTLTAWINTDTLDSNGGIVTRSTQEATKQYALNFAATNNNISFTVRSDSTHVVSSATDTITANSWYYVVGVADSGTMRVYVNGVTSGTTDTYTNGPVKDRGTAVADIGVYYRNEAGSEAFFNGQIDNVMIFDYALTQEQISWLYNKGKPIAYWKFDEGEGDTAYDSGENTNHGSLEDNAAFITSGKFNSALTLDGTGDYVDLGTNVYGNAIDGASGVTMSAWVKWESLTTGIYDNTIIFGSLHIPAGEKNNIYMAIKGDAGNVGKVYVCGRSNDNDSLWQTKISTTVTSLSTWHHIVGILDYANDEINIAVDGVLETAASVTFDGTVYTHSASTRTDGISSVASSGYEFDGTIDEVKIYNYTLTAEQIKMDYNQGAALRFGDQ